MADAEAGLLNGYKILRALRKAIISAKRSELSEVWETTQDPDNLNAIVDAYDEDPDKIKNTLSAIETMPGCAARSRNLRKVVERISTERETQRRQAQISQIESQLSQVSALSNALDVPDSVVDASVFSQLCTPSGYQIDANGVFKTSVDPTGQVQRNKIAASPIFIAGRTTDILSGEAKRQVVWRGAGGWCSKVVDRRTIMDARRVIQLSDFEAPVSSNLSCAVVAYLSDFEAENSHRLSAVRSAARMGWLPDGSFLLHDRHVTPQEDSHTFALTPAPGLESLAKGWSQEGDWSLWIGAVNQVKEFPLMMVSIYASCAAPVLSMLNLPGFVIDFSGETSGGKTTALRMAASVWGRPSDSYPTAMYSWDATKVWIERCAGFLHNLPLILDETKRAKHPNIVRDVIYDFCQGQGRGRGNPDGTRHIDHWRSVLISSGEGSATSFSQDAGTRARVLSLKGKPLGNSASQGGRISEDVQMLIADNYGHLGRKVIDYLVANQKNKAVIREAFMNTRERYLNAAQSAVARRHASHLAVLEITAKIVHQLGLPVPEFEPFEYLVEVMNKAGAEADRPLSALREVVNWCAVNQTKFYGRGELRGGQVATPSGGWAGVWSEDKHWDMIALTGKTTRDILSGAGYNAAEILERWYERKWLKAGYGRNRSRPVRINNVQARCYCLPRSIVEMAMDD